MFTCRAADNEGNVGTSAGRAGADAGPRADSSQWGFAASLAFGFIVFVEVRKAAAIVLSVGSLAEQPLPEVVDRALAEVRDAANKRERIHHLVELQNRPSSEVLQTALQLTSSADDDERELGIRVLGELGPLDANGRRPFSDDVVPHLRALLRTEHDPRFMALILSALGYNHAREALPDFLDHVEHVDDGVREIVAFHLPGVLDPATLVPDKVVSALETLCHDRDSDTRFYALHALVAEELVVEEQRVADLARDLVTDPDDQIRNLAQGYLDRGPSSTRQQRQRR